MSTNEIYDGIMSSSLFRLDGDEIDVARRLCELCDSIESEDETDWYMGEFLDCSLSDLVVGSYWGCQGWIADGCFGGSIANEPYYRLGRLFSPGMESGPDETSQYAYDVVNAWFEGVYKPSGKEVGS